VHQCSEESSLKITALGIDLAKNMMQLHGVDAKEHVVLRKKLARHTLLPVQLFIPSECSRTRHLLYKVRILLPWPVAILRRL
jgi:hypothetical protein